MRNQSQRVPIISPLEKNYELLENQDELNFSDDAPEPSFADAERDPQDFSPKKSAKVINSFQQNPTDDDLSPETLIHEDGALSPHECGRGKPMDQQFTIVDEREIGGGSGLDEAELAHLKPLDGKPWDQTQSDSVKHLKQGHHQRQNDEQQPLVFSPQSHHYRSNSR